MKALLQRLALFLTAAMLPGGALLAAPHKVEDLHYGDVLFHFYQEDYFGAIVRLLAAGASQRIENNEAESELLLGGLYLSYGLHKEADELFQRVLDDNADSEVRDRAWFFLAKIWYQRGHYDRSLAALDRIQRKLPKELEPERQLLGAQALMAAGRFEEALARFENLDGKSEWMAYARFNLGVALARLGRAQEAEPLLDRAGGMKADTEEMLALKDKANLALGYMRLQEERLAQAKEALSRVRLSGPFSNSALLGVGWADAAANDYQRALVPWMELSHRAVVDPAVQESLLAIPYAMGKLDAGTQSARHYQNAIEAYTDEMAYLDLSVQRVRDGRLIEDLLAVNDDPRRGWFWRLGRLPDQRETRYLYHMLADHGFQEALKNYRDLDFMADNLQDWSQSITAFESMLATRREAFAERLPRIESALASVNLETVEERRLAAASRLERIETGQDVLGLASAEEHRQWQMLEDMARRLERLPDTPEIEALRNKRRILAGHLYWRLNDEYAARLWQARKGLRELNQVVTLAVQRHKRVQAARENMPRRLDEFASRIAAIEPRIEALRNKTRGLANGQQKQIELLAVRELDLQKERLETYLVQARFALAAIYDRYAAEVSP